jgi:hypothetical protein
MALEADPNSRYGSALEFAYDLEHQEQAGVAERAVPARVKQQRQLPKKKVLFYGALAMLPVMVFALMLYVAHAG